METGGYVKVSGSAKNPAALIARLKAAVSVASRGRLPRLSSSRLGGVPAYIAVAMPPAVIRAATDRTRRFESRLGDACMGPPPDSARGPPFFRAAPAPRPST